MHLKKIIFLLLIAVVGIPVYCFSVRGDSKRRRRGKRGPQSMIVVEKLAGTGTKQVTHAGTKFFKKPTVIPAKPKRVVAFASSDPIFFLGYAPVAQAGYWDFCPQEHYLNPYAQAGKTGHVGGVYGARIPNAESVMTFKPDLIVATRFSFQNYKQFSKIAPVVLLPSYKKHNAVLSIIDMGKILGCEQRSLRAAVWYLRKVQLVRQALAEHASDVNKVSLLWYAGRRIRVCLRHFIYEELGLKPVTKVPWVGKHFKGSETYYMDPEQFAYIKADHLFVIQMKYRRKLSAANYDKLSIWKMIPAVQRDRVTRVHVGHWISGGPLGKSILMNEVVRAMLKPEHISPELKAMLKDRPSDEDLENIKLDSVLNLLKQNQADKKRRPGKNSRRGDKSKRFKRGKQ